MKKHTSQSPKSIKEPADNIPDIQGAAGKAVPYNEAFPKVTPSERLEAWARFPTPDDVDESLWGSWVKYVDDGFALAKYVLEKFGPCDIEVVLDYCRTYDDYGQRRLLFGCTANNISDRMSHQAFMNSKKAQQRAAMENEERITRTITFAPGGWPFDGSFGPDHHRFRRELCAFGFHSNAKVGDEFPDQIPANLQLMEVPEPTSNKESARYRLDMDIVDGPDGKEHIVPVNDFEEHVLSRSCKCKPMFDGESYVHRNFNRALEVYVMTRPETTVIDAALIYFTLAGYGTPGNYLGDPTPVLPKHQPLLERWAFDEFCKNYNSLN